MPARARRLQRAASVRYLEEAVKSSGLRMAVSVQAGPSQDTIGAAGHAIAVAAELTASMAGRL